MNNKIKIVTILTTAIIVTFVGVLVNNKKEVQANSAYNIRQKERIELFIRYNFQNVETVDFTTIEKNPMGGLFFNGLINKKITFHGTISIPGEDFENTLAGIDGEFFDENIKIGHDGTMAITPVSEILDEQKNND